MTMSMAYAVGAPAVNKLVASKQLATALFTFSPTTSLCSSRSPDACRQLAREPDLEAAPTLRGSEPRPVGVDARRPHIGVSEMANMCRVLSARRARFCSVNRARGMGDT